MIEGWMAQSADMFWGAVGPPPTLPRDLRRIVSFGFAIACVSLPDLRVRSVDAWFRQRGAPHQLLCNDRALCGCIVAARGSALIFICSDDSPAQQRFTVAHEIAHYLIDYLQPRQEARAALGAEIMPVLDGDRPPTATERVHAVLGRVKLGVYVDLMARVDEQSASPYVLHTESRADRLALELLAPADLVLADLATFPAQMSPFALAQSLNDLLRTKYGLPQSIARGYASWLGRFAPQRSTADWLGLR
jgi:hypothetical protein